MGFDSCPAWRGCPPGLQPFRSRPGTSPGRRRAAARPPARPTSLWRSPGRSPASGIPPRYPAGRDTAQLRPRGDAGVESGAQTCPAAHAVWDRWEREFDWLRTVSGLAECLEAGPHRIGGAGRGFPVGRARIGCSPRRRDRYPPAAAWTGWCWPSRPWTTGRSRRPASRLGFTLSRKMDRAVHRAPGGAYTLT
jgi:hypothetical protein